jgi:hypothetical protein
MLPLLPTRQTYLLPSTMEHIGLNSLGKIL